MIDCRLSELLILQCSNLLCVEVLTSCSWLWQEEMELIRVEGDITFIERMQEVQQ